MKLCKKCETEKPETDFPKDRSKPDGLNAYCKACAAAHTKAQKMRPPRRTPPPGLKWCGGCKQDLPLTEFHKGKETYDGLHQRCKTCSTANHRRWRLSNKTYVNRKQVERRAANPDRYADYQRKRDYGLAPGQYDEMLAAQDGQCAICGTDNSGKRGFAVDHCHDSKKIRGLLCLHCNTGIGQFKHNTRLLQLAIAYLESNSN